MLISKEIICNIFSKHFLGLQGREGLHTLPCRLPHSHSSFSNIQIKHLNSKTCIFPSRSSWASAWPSSSLVNEWEREWEKQDGKIWSAVKRPCIHYYMWIIFICDQADTLQLGYSQVREWQGERVPGSKTHPLLSITLSCHIYSLKFTHKTLLL